MRISLGPSVVRANIDESITGLWSFANANGLLTDVIGERTAAAGVTVDGLLVKDAGIPEAAVTAHEAALAILMSQVTGNIPDGQVPASAVTQHQAALSIAISQLSDLALLAQIADAETIAGLYTFAHASGLLSNLIGERTGGSGVTVDGTLLKDGGIKLTGLLEWSLQETTLAAIAHNFDPNEKTIQRFILTGNQSISGMVAGTSGQIVYLCNCDTSNLLSILNESGGSDAANRFILKDGQTRGLEDRQSAGFFYDATSARWRQLQFTETA